MKHIILLSFCALLTFSCSSNSVNIDYDRQIEFSEFKTYNFHPNNNLNINELDSVRITKAIANELTNKGYTLTKTNPAILVELSIQEYQSKQKIADSNIGIGSGNRGFGIGTSVSIPISKNVLTQEVQINILENQSHQLVWQSIFFINKSSHKNKELIYKKSIIKSFKNYPPQKK
jgi:hypothetical protein